MNLPGGQTEAFSWSRAPLSLDEPRRLPPLKSASQIFGRESGDEFRREAEDAVLCDMSYLFIMDLDDLLRRYFSSTDLSAVSPDVLASGLERCHVDLGLEQDSGKRFVRWALLYMLGSAPDLEAAFKDAADREAARHFMDLLAASESGGQGGQESGVQRTFARPPESNPASSRTVLNQVS